MLQRARLQGSLPRLSGQLGQLIRTNSESILAVTVPPEHAKGLGNRVAITSSIYPDADTHIETCVFAEAGGANKALMALLTPDGTRLTRPLKAVLEVAKNPRKLWRLLREPGWSERTVIVLVMQSLDNALSLTARRKRFGSGIKLQTKQTGKPAPTYIDAGYRFARWLEEKTGGIAQGGVMEVLANLPTTAHFLGGCPIGPSPERGVLDGDLNVYGYANLKVVDGAAVPRQRRREPVAHHHRARRARDGLRAASGRPRSRRRPPHRHRADRGQDRARRTAPARVQRRERRALGAGRGPRERQRPASLRAEVGSGPDCGVQQDV